MALPGEKPHRRRACRGHLVVEARERSGALITADLALDEGREVMAVPGEITSHLSDGTNGLLRLGATPVTSTADVLAALGIDAPPQSGVPLDARLAGVRDAVAEAAATANELARSTGLPAGEVAAALTELELLGVVREVDGVYRVDA